MKLGPKEIKVVNQYLIRPVKNRLKEIFEKKNLPQLQTANEIKQPPVKTSKAEAPQKVEIDQESNGIKEVKEDPLHDVSLGELITNSKHDVLQWIKPKNV